MSGWMELLRWAHILGACVLIGTGVGIAFFMLMVRQNRDPAIVAHVAGTVVLADFLFTATAVVVQPLTGVMLARGIGWPLDSRWIILSGALYLLIGLCWLPVVWIQLRLRDLARDAAAAGEPLPQIWFSLYRVWFVLGIPAFTAILLLLWLMVTRPL